MLVIMGICYIAYQFVKIVEEKEKLKNPADRAVSRVESGVKNRTSLKPTASN